MKKTAIGMLAVCTGVNGLKVLQSPSIPSHSEFLQSVNASREAPRDTKITGWMCPLDPVTNDTKFCECCCFEGTELFNPSAKFC